MVEPRALRLHSPRRLLIVACLLILPFLLHSAPASLVKGQRTTHLDPLYLYLYDRRPSARCWSDFSLPHPAAPSLLTFFPNLPSSPRPTHAFLPINPINLQKCSQLSHPHQSPPSQSTLLLKSSQFPSPPRLSIGPPSTPARQSCLHPFRPRTTETICFALPTSFHLLSCPRSRQSISNISRRLKPLAARA